MDELTSTPGLVALGACALALVALVVATVAVRRLRRLRNDQRRVLGAHGDTDLIAHAAHLEEQFIALNEYVAEVAARLDGRLSTAEGRLDGSISGRALLRYDAYNEMSGRQSATIALLDARRSGIVLSSIAHRDQARMYVKEVHEGRGELELSPEELEAVRLASAAPPPAPDAPPPPDGA